MVQLFFTISLFSILISSTESSLWSFLFQNSPDLQCRDLNGKPVDWFVAYKLPVLDDNGPQFKDGLNFLYADSKSRSWTISDKKINDPNSAIGATLNQLWTIKDDNVGFYFKIAY